MITHADPITHTARAYRETAQRLQRTHPRIVPIFDAMAAWHEHLRKPKAVMPPNDFSIVFRRGDFADNGVEIFDGEHQTFVRSDELRNILDRIDMRQKLSFVAEAIGTPASFGKAQAALGIGTVAYDQMQVFGERIDRLMRVNSETFSHIGVTGTLAGRPLKDILTEMDQTTAATFQPESWRNPDLNHLPHGKLGQAGYGGPANVLFIDNVLSVQGQLTVRAATSRDGKPTLAIDIDGRTEDRRYRHVFDDPREGALTINALLHDRLTDRSPAPLHEVAATTSAIFLSRAKGAGILPPEYELGKPTFDQIVATHDLIGTRPMLPAYVPVAIETHDLRNLADISQRREDLKEMIKDSTRLPAAETETFRPTFQVQITAAELEMNPDRGRKMPRHSDNVVIVVNAFVDAVAQPEFTRKESGFQTNGHVQTGSAGINYMRASFGPRDVQDILRDRFPELHTLSPDWKRFEDRPNPTYFSVGDASTGETINFTAPERQLRNDVRAYLSHTVAEGLVATVGDRLSSTTATRALHIDRKKALDLIDNMTPSTVITVHAAMKDVMATNKIRATDRVPMAQIARSVAATLSKAAPARESAGVEL